MAGSIGAGEAFDFRRYAPVERSDTVLMKKCSRPNDNVFAAEEPASVPDLGEAARLLWRALSWSASKNTRAARGFFYRLCHDLRFVWLLASFGWGTLLTLIALMAVLK